MKLTGANVLAKGAALPAMFPFEFGGYRVLGLLGRGGMGAVYEAEQIDTGRRVALKVLGHGMDSEEMRKRFLREGRLAAAVSHPNSIYIFGTEEIEGAPVIVMEIAGGGTLKDELKRRGPLPVREAVDAMLQIIAGLEAAHAGGVLHRDVKPANCFIAPDGTAKVGDFGLSVSTLARTDTQLTASGMMLGTPSFAPPEQLRGDELDLRADIYSVGATLYTLLTGKAPFEGTNAVQVVAAVLDKAPKPVAELRADVPAGLAQLIARCLAKKREERFASYAELRDALLPFSSQVPVPAPLRLRVFAGFIDEMIIVLPDLAVGFFVAYELSDKFLVERTLAAFLPWAGMLYWGMAYYAVCEGLWGAGIGKALCGLRVIGPDRAAPGLLRASVRVACMMLVLNVYQLVALVSMTGAEYERRMVSDDSEFFWFTLLFGIFLASWAALFLTMRLRNGFAAVHDLVSGTRVVLRAKTTARPRLEAPALPAPAENGGRIGPYRVGEAVGGGFIAGHDEVLRRPVWIRHHEAGAAPVSDARRAAARATRLRWIGGARTDAANWDAFEALPGQPLSALAPQSQSWEAARLWLQDLTLELDAADKDGTLPATLTLAHVWLTTDGRAVLLDEAWEVTQASSLCVSQASRLQAEVTGGTPITHTGGTPVLQDAQKFLHAVTHHALNPVTAPLHALDFIQKLAAGSFDRLSFVAGNIESLLARPAAISRKRRAASLLLVPFFLMFSFSMTMLAFRLEEGHADAQWRTRHSDLPPLSQVLRLMYATDPEEGELYAWKADGSLHHATQVHIVGHYRDRLTDVVTQRPEKHPDVPLSKDERTLIRMLFATYGPLVDGQLAQADARLKTALATFRDEELKRLWITCLYSLLNISCFIAVTQFFSLLIFGGTLGQKVFGFAVVNKSGERAGRLRLLGRWFIAWVPFMLLFARLEVAAFTHKDLATADIVKCSLYGVVWALCIIAAILRPAQGFHDEQTKTWLVPR